MTRPSPRSSRPKSRLPKPSRCCWGMTTSCIITKGNLTTKDYTSLKETTYQADGLRAMLLQRNRVAVNEVNRLKQQKLDLKISEDDYRKQLSGIKSGKDTPTVIIKATDKSSYKNLIDALDEMQICNIGKYVITDIAEADEFLMKNYESKGELSQNIAE